MNNEHKNLMGQNPIRGNIHSGKVSMSSLSRIWRLYDRPLDLLQTTASEYVSKPHNIYFIEEVT